MPQAGEEASDQRPIARLRRVATALARLEAPHPADCGWFVASIARYEAACRSGVSLDMDAAMGLGQPGRAGWWSEELRSRRDELLRELHRRHFPDLAPGRAATAIARLARRLEQAGLEQARGDEALELLAEALVKGLGIPGPRQLKRVLELDMKGPLSFPVDVSSSASSGSGAL